jgi:uncharacterized protein (DUF2252 family)
MDIFEATRSYESWMGRHTDIVRRDLILKHERMAESAFVFLRATFYRWVQMWPNVCAHVANAPKVLAVGDLHVENFGTWRDSEGRLVWGVNDFDEVCELPYTQDLVRLATSAVLAVRQRHFGLSTRDACEAIVDGYAASRERHGQPMVLAERRRWLRQMALGELRDPVAFWAKLDAPGSTPKQAPHEALRYLLPDPKMPYRVLRRVAGAGSLGRPRFLALAEWGGALIAREAKAAIPSAAVWAAGRSSAAIQCSALVRCAVRVPDPLFAIRGRWIIRRLAPDCSRIELGDLPKKRDEQRLLRAMGWETANVHLGTRRPQVDADLRTRPSRWLEEAATAMADVVQREWRKWTR